MLAKAREIVFNMGKSVRKMKFIKRTIVSLIMGFAAVLISAIIFENFYYWGASHGNILVGIGLAISQFVVYKDDIDKMVANAKGKSVSKDTAKQAERQAAPQGNETNPKSTSLEDEAKAIGDEFAAVDGESDGDEPPEEFTD